MIRELCKIAKFTLYKINESHSTRYNYYAFALDENGDDINFYWGGNILKLLEYSRYDIRGLEIDVAFTRSKDKLLKSYKLIGEFNSLEEFREHYIEYLI